MVSVGYPGWSPGRTCTRFATLWLSWDVANPRTTMPFPFQLASNQNPSVQFPFSACTVFAIWISQLSIEGERFGSDGYVTFRVFSDLVFKYFLPGLTGLFFARKMHSTSEFAKTVLSKCVNPLKRCKTSIAAWFYFILVQFHAGGDRVAAWLSPTKLHAVSHSWSTNFSCQV